MVVQRGTEPVARCTKLRRGARVERWWERLDLLHRNTTPPFMLAIVRSNARGPPVLCKGCRHGDRKGPEIEPGEA